MQSGLDKGTFSVDSKLDSVHKGEVTGLGLDSLNKLLVSSSLDMTVKLWDFFRAKLMKTYQHTYSIDNLVYNRVNDLVAISSSDLSLTLLNAKTGLKKVRSFAQIASNKITDLCFSYPDCRWLLCSSLDKSIRVWDILTGSLVDWI